MSSSTPASPSSTPLSWRLIIVLTVIALGGLAWVLRDTIGLRGQGLVGIFCFLGVALALSSNIRRINWRIVLVGLALQFTLAVLVLEVSPVRWGFEQIGNIIKRFLDFSVAGSKFVFGKLADQEFLDEQFGPGTGFVFAFRALPTIIFVSAFFSILYYFGLMQWVVRGMAWVMRRTMGTGGAESLSAAANVFMGQTEAPLLVKPYVRRMNRSQLLALMVGGMATVSGGMLAVYTSLGADPVALLTTSVMAAPAGLYIAKILVPDPLPKDSASGKSIPREPTPKGEKLGVNAIDAAARGARAGLMLALNVAAMLIVFIAFIAMINACLAPFDLSLERILSHLFAPAAFLMGIPEADVPRVGELLGIKLVSTELIAFERLGQSELTQRAVILTTFALTGFANFASIGIQIGGIGAIAPKRRETLAKLGMRALLGGFLATMINASIAGILL